MTPRTVEDVLRALPARPGAPLPAPAYVPPPDADGRPRVMFAVESMRRHMTSEGWELQEGLEHAGYELAGWALDTFDDAGHSLSSQTDVRRIVGFTKAGTVFVQDKREWVGKTAGPGFDRRETFTNVACLADRPDIFRGTLVKDAQHDNDFHRESAREIGAHFWVTPYDVRVVHRLAPYTRPRHLVRCYHTIDAALVPAYTPEGRDGCILSGAVSPVYPLRQRCVMNVGALWGTAHHRHPGYHRRGTTTPSYLQTLSRFKVAICTSSIFGFSLRKLIEATACGCVVITDLPTDDVLPAIDGNLVRVHPSITLRDLSDLIRRLCDGYDAGRQEEMAKMARERYDCRAEGVRLAGAIEDMRRTYTP